MIEIVNFYHMFDSHAVVLEQTCLGPSTLDPVSDLQRWIFLAVPHLALAAY